MNANPKINLSKDEQAGKFPYMRPRDASTLLILDKTAAGPFRVLMGRRHMGHAFMPGKFVFPGGRLDPGDSRVNVATSYEPAVEEKLSAQMKGPKSAARVRALALAAVRETYEEAGIFIGVKRDGAENGPRTRIGKGFEAFEERGIELDLTPFRMVARAITPPQRPRRFDARFLAVWGDAIAAQMENGMGPSGELEDVEWLTLDEAREKEIPAITKRILGDLEERLVGDPKLAPETPVPFYFFRSGGFQRDFI